MCTSMGWFFGKKERQGDVRAARAQSHNSCLKNAQSSRLKAQSNAFSKNMIIFWTRMTRIPRIYFL